MVFLTIPVEQLATALENYGFTGGEGIGVTFSDTVPSNPQPGQLWLSSVNNELRVYNGVSWSLVTLSADEKTQLASLVATVTACQTAQAGAESARNTILNMTVATGAPGSLASWNPTTGILTVPRGDNGLKGDSVTAVTSSKVGKTTTVEVFIEGVLEHTFTVLDGEDGTGTGDMLKAVYDTTNNGIVDAAETVPWSGVTGTPATYPPATHNHDNLYYTESEIDSLLGSKQNTLISGTNIKTINGTSILNSGDITTGDVTLTGSQTLTNKTITGLKETSVAMPANDINLVNGNLFTKTISGATTLTVSNVPTAGTVGYFILQLTNGGSATVTWFSGVKWAGGTAPTLTASGKDILSFYTIDAGTTWNVVGIQKDVK